MRSSITLGYMKTRTCPPSETLLLYIESTLAGERLNAIHTHLCACDFCAAEMQFLAKFPPRGGDDSFVAREISPTLRRLAEDMLSEPSLNRARFVETICEIERLSLTDA
jgi:hypothetical protein